MNNNINFNKVVNYDKETNEITVLDYIFFHEDGFKGATGSRFEPISRAYYEESIEKENVMDKLRDCGLVESCNDLAREAGLESIYNQMDVNGEIEYFMFDLSYQGKLWDIIRQELPQFASEEEYPVFNCTGGGRCFDDNFNGNVNTELSSLIRKAESSMTAEEFEAIKKGVSI